MVAAAHGVLSWGSRGRMIRQRLVACIGPSRTPSVLRCWSSVSRRARRPQRGGEGGNQRSA
eukprot:8589463-Pyramimonas_sp.AAC.1